MPEKKTLDRARKDAREGKSPSTQAGEFVREEIDHIREGKHGARSAKQAIAIGLSKARRAGVKLGAAQERIAGDQETRAASRKGSKSTKKPSAKRSRATSSALKREGPRGRLASRAFPPGPKRRRRAERRQAESRSLKAAAAADPRLRTGAARAALRSPRRVRWPSPPRNLPAPARCVTPSRSAANR